MKIVARAVGPSLGNSGVVGALQDPTLEVPHYANGNMTSNDNWRDTQQDELLADQLAPTDDRESALAATLSPAPTPRSLAGKNDTSGVALIEFYQLP